AHIFFARRIGMDYAGVMAQLKKLGTAQTAKTYGRHGAAKSFGVSFADIYKLQKQIKQDHALAERLWASGYTEAQVLGALVADPSKVTAALADQWIKTAGSNMYLAGLVAKSPVAQKKMLEWMKSPKEMYRAAGYHMLGVMMRDDGALPDADCRRILQTIEKEIHSSPNRARYAMNNALIGIGSYRPALTQEALAAAKRIGKVDVDHGDTSCKTPEAVETIQKVVAYEARKKRKGAQGGQRRALKKA
ncbi:MAG: DNA alkylation repair protein, partial [Candidatus Acidiferrales bacterium]